MDGKQIGMHKNIDGEPQKGYRDGEIRHYI